MSTKVGEKTARLLALAHTIQEGYLNPDTINMAELANLLDVHRGTIMRDLRVVQDVMDRSKEIQAMIRNNPISDNPRRAK